MSARRYARKRQATPPRRTRRRRRRRPSKYQYISHPLRLPGAPRSLRGLGGSRAPAWRARRAQTPDAVIRFHCFRVRFQHSRERFSSQRAECTPRAPAARALARRRPAAATSPSPFSQPFPFLPHTMPKKRRNSGRNKPPRSRGHVRALSGAQPYAQRAHASPPAGQARVLRVQRRAGAQGQGREALHRAQHRRVCRHPRSAGVLRLRLCAPSRRPRFALCRAAAGHNDGGGARRASLRPAARRVHGCRRRPGRRTLALISPLRAAQRMCCRSCIARCTTPSLPPSTPRRVAGLRTCGAARRRRFLGQTLLAGRARCQRAECALTPACAPRRRWCACAAARRAASASRPSASVPRTRRMARALALRGPPPALPSRRALLKRLVLGDVASIWCASLQ